MAGLAEDFRARSVASQEAFKNIVTAANFGSFSANVDEHGNPLGTFSLVKPQSFVAAITAAVMMNIYNALADMIDFQGGPLTAAARQQMELLKRSSALREAAALGSNGDWNEFDIAVNGNTVPTDHGAAAVK